MKIFRFLFLFHFIVISSSVFSQNQFKIDSLKTNLRQSNDNNKKIKLLNELCWLYRNTDTDSALIFGTRALELSDSIVNIEEKLKALSFTGVIYRNKGIYAKALELYYEGVKLAKKHNNFEQLTYAYINIGNLHIYRNEMNQALNFFEKAFESSKNNDNITQKAYLYYNLGRTYTELGNYKKARYFIDRVIKMRKKNHDKEGLTIAKKNLGDILIQEDKTEEALKEYEEALKISKRLNTNKTIIATLKNEIAKIFASQKKYKKAKEYANESLIISQQIGAKFREKEANLTLSNIYKSQNLYKKAYLYYMSYSQIKDYLFSTESDRQINSIKTLFKINEEKNKNEQLQIEKIQNLAEIKQQKIICCLIAGIFLILIFFLLIIIKILNQKKLLKSNSQKILSQSNALKKSEEKYKNILNNMIDVYYQSDNEQNLICINPSGVKELGYDNEEELLGKNFPKDIYYFEDDRAKFLSAIQKEGVVKNFEILLKNKDGKALSFEANSKFMYNNSGKRIGVEGIMRNISKRKASSLEITKLSTAIKQSPTTILITDLQGNIEYANPHFEKLTGYTAKEVMGLNPKNFNSGKTSNKTYVEMWKTISSGKTWKGEFINKKKNGEEFIEKAIVSPIKNDKNEIVNYIAVKEDITKQKDIEEELKTAKEQAEGLNATKDKFFSIIAHDLKSPFNAILGFSNLLLLNHKKISKEKREEYIENISKSSQNAYNLLENLLVWARTQQGAVNFSPEKISLKSLFKNIVELHTKIALGKKITLNYFLTDDININADRNMITSVLHNLITNALKFTNIKGSVNISAMLIEKNVKITVEDNGVGIDKKTQNKIFGLNTSQSKLGTAGETGTGLGLVLCKEFVEKHNGKIWVESELEKGSRFIFTLPTE
ncbi:MAG: PAS domain S-box protein [Bacteroidetes bacterium]|nr:PAS domain S-box protein [Bacteroidota bacterium]